MAQPEIHAQFTAGKVVDNYKLGKTLGSGSFASVKLATHRKEKNRWAAKLVDRKALTEEDRKGLEQEIQIMFNMHHPNIVQLRECYCSDTHICLVQELMSGGELFDRVVEKEYYTENEARVCIMQLVSALSYCHDRGVSHRDLKPENLLYSDATETAVLKVADFGLAKLVKENEMMQTSCGTPGYVAPEVLLGKSYDSAVDMWSTGVILYILLCGFPPFYDDNNAALFAAIKAGRYDFPSPYWDAVSEDAKNCVRSLLVVNPKERATARALLANPWVAEELPVHETNLKASLSELRKYNMRRKFKAAVRVAGLFNVRQ